MTKSKEKIVPRLYAQLAIGTPADLKVSGDDAPVIRPFVADLVVLYAFDMGDRFEMVAQRDLKALGLTADDLHSVSIQNLRALNLEIGVQRAERVMMLTAGGTYEATLILLPDVWSSICGMVEGSVVVAVPARDVIYVTGDAKPECLSDIEGYTRHALTKVDKPLSRHLLKWTGTEWQSIKELKE